MVEKNQKFLTVPPFECAWRKDLRFREAGRGCVAFEAFAHNDVTVVFREQVGSQHYHYKRDNSPHYTVILGSHRNRRLRIEVDGKTVVDVAGIGLCCSSAFQSYWISFYDGLISIGRGRYPFQNLVFQWLDSNPNCSVQYIGLSSWDKHVGYRNVNVLPLTQNHISLWKQVDCGGGEHDGVEDSEEDLEDGRASYERWGLENFLERWELSDFFFIAGVEERLVPAHKVILAASGNFHLSSSGEDVIQLQSASYPVVHALLQYIYTGQTQITDAQLGSLRALSLQFEVMPLVKQCDEVVERLKLNKKLFESGKNVQISYTSCQPHSGTSFPFGTPVNIQRLKHLHSTGEHTNVDIYIEGHGLVAQTHKIILGLWSVPFTKMFTNGMSESMSSNICLKDVSPQAFKSMLKFMYSGQLVLKDDVDDGTLLLQLLLLADQFGVTLLHQECCKMLLECLSEDSVCPILQVVSSVPSCKLIEEMCKKKYSMQFDYCTTASTDFVFLDEATFTNILQHPDLTVTSEERVLNAILCWCMQAKELYGWEVVDELLEFSKPELLFGERLGSVNDLLPFVRFPLMPYPLLKKLEKTNLSRIICTFDHLVKESINHIEFGLSRVENDQNIRFQHRRSSYKELQYICDGDSNGVLYFSGTSYGKHQWVNPVLAKRITISASSPISRHTDPKALVSRTYQGTFFAGPRLEDGKKCAWWMVDIGQDHQLMCNYYTLRQDGSRAYIRSWNIQGSGDGKGWTTLRVHENDQTMCKPGQFASWPITGPTSLLPFRFFRVILTDRTSDDSNPWNFCICFLELYGYLR
ncbi:BTB/POZ domain-containing protein At2g30600 isoform X1 [Malania oleifera]|uniref:BTB/POZ domain-containing protein At2g30600 isoform X1 n=1 Tax=Malania oleifera TaxID=397392 RepID=UPI0025ADDA6D|nr:BTB/POZ domain-containing protein At2g30600 isoform X1 [Malania oleifera]XP_057974401.1 BTB/POZ domain-containing protein At2g30600 isoform X1 [Malania oleifera]XP_057974402.1 BTB/POZ domain-containing protein At2g30600 isoform X1 [Malania oleifera]XP_057974403.1 BTB/POZ domain-containing protein At2g30600 isoform X1 [Malania oleifera]XP_057974405.1 BTB/POZ domain-containing protein At2g30600 isoform X1 [Malania oleifera]XP_057974406.1 BTB/POZ domain-containing protein At2g30600 isoform X1 